MAFNLKHCMSCLLHVSLGLEGLRGSAGFFVFVVFKFSVVGSKRGSNQQLYQIQKVSERSWKVSKHCANTNQCLNNTIRAVWRILIVVGRSATYHPQKSAEKHR